MRPVAVSYIICIADAGFTDHTLKQGIVQIAELKMDLPFFRQESRFVPAEATAATGARRPHGQPASRETRRVWR